MYPVYYLPQSNGPKVIIKINLQITLWSTQTAVISHSFEYAFERLMEVNTKHSADSTKSIIRLSFFSCNLVFCLEKMIFFLKFLPAMATREMYLYGCSVTVLPSMQLAKKSQCTLRICLWRSFTAEFWDLFRRLEKLYQSRTSYTVQWLWRQVANCAIICILTASQVVACQMKWVAMEALWLAL